MDMMIGGAIVLAVLLCGYGAGRWHQRWLGRRARLRERLQSLVP